MLHTPTPPHPLQVCRRHSGAQQETCLSVSLTEDVKALLASEDCFVHLRFCPKPASKAELTEDEYPKQLYVKVNSSAITIPVGGTLPWLLPVHSVSSNTSSPPNPHLTSSPLPSQELRPTSLHATWLQVPVRRTRCDGTAPT